MLYFYFMKSLYFLHVIFELLSLLSILFFIIFWIEDKEDKKTLMLLFFMSLFLLFLSIITPNEKEVYIFSAKHYLNTNEFPTTVKQTIIKQLDAHLKD